MPEQDNDVIAVRNMAANKYFSNAKTPVSQKARKSCLTGEYKMLSQLSCGVPTNLVFISCSLAKRAKNQISKLEIPSNCLTHCFLSSRKHMTTFWLVITQLQNPSLKTSAIMLKISSENYSSLIKTNECPLTKL